MTRAWLAASVVLVAALAARPVRADDSAACDYLEITATTGKPSIDAQARPLEKKLKRPPFSSWNVFHTLSSGHVTLAKLKAQPLALKQGAASVLFRDRDGRRLELTIAVDGADGKRLLDARQSAVAGEWSVFVHNVKDDGHILALTCK